MLKTNQNPSELQWYRASLRTETTLLLFCLCKRLQQAACHKHQTLIGGFASEMLRDRRYSEWTGRTAGFGFGPCCFLWYTTSVVA